MEWFAFAIITAFSLSSADALSKKALSRSDEFVIVWVREGYALPFLLLGLLFIQIPALESGFWQTLAILIPLEILALVLYVKAIRVSPLSLTIPFMAVSPVFILFIAFALLGEWPTPLGLVGVLCIAAGAYLLNANASKSGPLGPIKAIIKEPGSVMMLAVAFIYIITSTLGKVAVEHSSPVFFGFFYPLVLTIILTPAIIYKGQLRQAFSRPATFIPIGALTAIMIITHFVAISMTDVAYMISVKRTSLLFSVLYGHFLFGEEDITQRLLGSSIMVMGVILITLSQGFSL